MSTLAIRLDNENDVFNPLFRNVIEEFSDSICAPAPVGELSDVELAACAASDIVTLCDPTVSTEYDNNYCGAVHRKEPAYFVGTLEQRKRIDVAVTTLIKMGLLEVHGPNNEYVCPVHGDFQELQDFAQKVLGPDIG